MFFKTSLPIWHLHVNGQVIRTTEEHPFYVWGKGWVATKNLKVGDRLRSDDGRQVEVEEVFDTGVEETVYNCAVAGYHTYFVGADSWGFSVWAHNQCAVYQEIKNGKVKYVGITNNFARRAGEHLRLYGRVIQQIMGLGKITRKQARALEHLLVAKYGRVKDRTGKLLGGQLDNVNGGIDKPKLKNYVKELKWAAKMIAKLGL